jgi:hypothetical protein
MINPYDSSDQGSGEFSEMQRVIGEMLFRVLPRVDLATRIGNAEGLAMPSAMASSNHSVRHSMGSTTSHIVHTVKMRNVQRAKRRADQVLASVKEAVRLKAMRRTG